MYRSIFWGMLSIALISIDPAIAVKKKANGDADAPPNPSKTSEIPTSHYSGLEVSMGKPYAPLTIIMYYSLTCPHCHEFQEKILPEIKAEFIDKNLVRFVFRDFPTDQLALKGAKVAWCMGKDHYLTIAKKLLATQDDWAPIDPAKLKDAEKALLKIAGEFAITSAEYRRCLANKEVEDTILRTSFEAQKTHQIMAAPAFLVNGKVFGEDMTVKAIHKLLLEMGIHG
ncbi:MAG: thioredoxin domain-containing protein [Candidatus Paracaedibacter sp.]